MKYEARKTHGRDKLYVRAGEGGCRPIVKVKIKEGIIDKKEKKYRGVNPVNTGEGARPNEKLRGEYSIANIGRVGGSVNYSGKREDK